jgi:hypothetical protein
LFRRGFWLECEWPLHGCVPRPRARSSIAASVIIR